MESDEEDEQVTGDEREHRVVPAAGTAPAAEHAEGSSVITLVSILVRMDMLFVPSFFLTFFYPFLMFSA